jgi:hypothetical protein
MRDMLSNACLAWTLHILLVYQIKVCMLFFNWLGGYLRDYFCLLLGWKRPSQGHFNPVL